jgi:Tfp pilus assembly protein PilF
MGLRQKLLRSTDDHATVDRIVHELRMIEGDDGVQWRFELASARLRIDPSVPAAAEARDHLKRCLESRPGWIAARSLMGLAQERLGELAEAIESYRAAIALDPDLSTHAVALRLIDALKRAGRFDEADAVLAPIARARPEAIDVQRLLAEQHLRRQDLPSAAVAAENILKLTPQDESWSAMTIELLVRAGQLERAEETAREAFRTHPGSISVAAALARTLTARQKHAEAVSFARTLAGEKRQAPYDVLLARVLAETNDAAQAEQALATAIGREPDNPEVHAAVAEFWAARGDRRRQVYSIRTTIRLRGEKEDQSLWLAGVLATGSSEERRQSRDILQARRAVHADDVDAHLLDAQLAVTDDPPDLDRAEQSLSSALKHNPRLANAYKLLTTVYIRKNDLLRARDTATAGLMAAGDDPDMLVLSAEVAQLRGEWDASMIPLRRLLAMSRAPLRAYDLMVSAALQTRQVHAAIGVLQQTGEAPPELGVFLGRLYESAGDAVAASGHFRAAAEKAPATGVPAYLLFLARQGEWSLLEQWADDEQAELPYRLTACEILASMSNASRQRGFDRLDKLATQHPRVAADARYRAGMAHLKHADFVSAETMLLAAVRLAPQSPKPANALAWLYGEELSNPARGLEVLAAFERHGGNATPEMLDTHGMLLLRGRRWAEAEAVLRECLRRDSHSAATASAWFHLALVHLERQEHDEAQRCLKTALEKHERTAGLTPRQLEECRRLLADRATSG